MRFWFISRHTLLLFRHLHPYSSKNIFCMILYSFSYNACCSLHVSHMMLHICIILILLRSLTIVSLKFTDKIFCVLTSTYTTGKYRKKRGFIKFTHPQVLIDISWLQCFHCDTYIFSFADPECIMSQLSFALSRINHFFVKEKSAKNDHHKKSCIRVRYLTNENKWSMHAFTCTFLM